MIYSSACAYAIRALSRMALMRPDGYILLDDLCKDTDLPRHFVAKIFQDLVRHDLLISAKGRGGGFAFARPPAGIPLYDIVAAIDGVEELDQCVVGMERCNDEQPCPQHDQWKSIRGVLRKFLQETSLERMANTLGRKMELLGQPLPAVTTKSKPLVREQADEQPARPTRATPEKPARRTGRAASAGSKKPPRRRTSKAKN